MSIYLGDDVGRTVNTLAAIGRTVNTLAAIGRTVNTLAANSFIFN